MSTTDRRSYDTAASAQTQANLTAVISRLETVLDARDRQVQAAMADFQADGVSELYQGKELQWRRAAAQTRQIVSLLRTTMQRNDTTAAQTIAQAKIAVESI
ncbi:hypothetical protein SAMN05892883_0210 [Jatrophihabitans sp. GAS493]|uniref:pore-forming ESAT-6 family protein n=1 Tax=Jatrophihabitans sp. GAS493 TaxID=1907575 RepID=UPI000BBF5331|nr:pore-forming ESAT-6 family protein [Jatrophihabitans sp. GAS493]SOD70519.1 hypothetical protein SAMN05892883_0210 [Jatrophihabitans sp. GAS493]